MMTPEEPLPAPAESAVAPAGRERALVARWPGLVLVAVLLLAVGAIAVLGTLLAGGGRPLYPNLPTYTPLAEEIAGEPVLLTFTELNADPAAFRDRRVQVSGDFASVEAPACMPYAGPAIHWSLVAEELQLNAIGFENVLSLLSEGTPMTVSGIWRLYQGPVGCGKEPDDGNVWYLAVDQIIEPNPLFGAGDVALTVMAGSPLPTLSPLDLSTVTPGATPTLSPTAGAPGTVVVTPTTGLPTAVLPTPTLGGTPTTLITPSPTATQSTPGTPTVTGTPTPTGTPGPSPTASPTGGAGQTTTPGIPTVTPGSPGYPEVTATTELYP